MKCRRSLFMCIIPFLVGLFGCSTCEPAYSIQTPSAATFASTKNVYQNGLIYVSAGTAYFLDYDSFSGVPLCNQPNCTHSSNTCAAKIVTNFGMNSTPPVVYRDQVYYFTETDNIAEGGDGESTSYEIQCQLHRIDISSGEQTLVCEFDEMEATCSSCVYLHENTLYFIANNGALQDDAGAWYYFTSAGVQYLCAVDLDSGTFTNCGQVNTTDHVNSTLFVKDGGAYGLNGDVRIQGMYDGKLWMSYYYADSADTLLEAFQESGDVPDIANPVWHTELVAYDFEAQEISRTETESVPCVGNGYYIDWDADQGQYIAQQGDKKITLRDFPKDSFLSIVNDLVFNRLKTDACFDLSDQKARKINSEYTEKGISVVDFHDNAYIVQYYDSETESDIFEAVTENKLLNT